MKVNHLATLVENELIRFWVPRRRRRRQRRLAAAIHRNNYFYWSAARLLIGFLFLLLASRSGLPDGLFSNQNSQFGQFWRSLYWKFLIYFMATWNILKTFGIFYDQFVHFVFIWYIFSEKSGNPGVDPTEAFSAQSRFLTKNKPLFFLPKSKRHVANTRSVFTYL
jgi:hypothetical protein